MKQEKNENVSEIVKNIDHVRLRQIKKTIGKGYAGKIKEFLQDKGITRSEGYIRIKMNDLEDQNNEILFNAVLLAAEMDNLQNREISIAQKFLDKKTYVK